MDIREAQEFYKSMDCNKFLMWREAPLRLAEYEKLNLPAATEKQWQREHYDTCLQVARAALRENPETLHEHIGRMVDIAELAHEPDIYISLLDALQELKACVPAGYRVLAAEHIVGKDERDIHKNRRGLVYMVYDLGLHDLAYELLLVAKALLVEEMAFSISARKQACADLIQTVEHNL